MLANITALSSQPKLMSDDQNEDNEDSEDVSLTLILSSRLPITNIFQKYTEYINSKLHVLCQLLNIFGW